MRRELTGRHVLICLLASFGTIFAVNGVFAYFAVTKFPGLETQDAYRTGLAFNQQIARAEQLKALGWTMKVSRLGADGLSLEFLNEANEHLTVSAVSATLFHPTDAKGDRPLAVVVKSRGSVTASMQKRAIGQWQLRVAGTGPGGRAIEFRRALWLD